jgi:mevalonate kinase
LNFVCVILLMEISAPGKLLITGEYAVLHGAKALAVPTRLSQHLKVTKGSSGRGFHWLSREENGNVWFEAHFDRLNLDILETSDLEKAEKVKGLLRCGLEIDSTFFEDIERVEFKLDFPLSWGLGSSSTLVASLSQWMHVNGFYLMKKVWQGSGYDVAVGTEKTSLIYELEDGRPKWENVTWNPSFSDQLYFVHLNKKMDSSKAVVEFLTRPKDQSAFARISEITESVAGTDSYSLFKLLLEEHNAIIEQLLEMPQHTKQIFPFFDGLVKPLGAWGGDFVLIGTSEKPHDVFKAQGYDTIFSFKELIRE